MWRLGSWLEKLPFSGKHKLERVVQGQSLSNCRRPRKYRPVDIKLLTEFEKFQNPDPLYRLIWDASESQVKVEGLNFKALIDSGAQVSLISEPMTKLLGLEIQDLQTLLGLEGAHGGEVPYLGYTKLCLEILEVSDFR